MTAEQLEVRVHGETADEAIAQARAWARSEPNFRLLTIAKVRNTGPMTWIVTIAVRRLVPA